jgi:hypothetical protein
MSFTVWNASDPAGRAEWLQAWSEWPEREVFAHPAYLQLYETDNDRPLCAAWRDENATVLFPLLMRRIPFAGSPPCCDLSTPYGYGGPFVWSRAGCGHGKADHDRVSGKYWEAYENWTREQGVVSEFIRFHLFPESLLSSYPGERAFRMTNVVRTLDLPLEELWHDFDYKVRKNVKRARASGIEIIHDPEGSRIEDFLRIYRGTMTRRQALGAYDFPEEFFRRIQAQLGGCHTYFHAVLKGAVIASELVLLSPHHAYSFLGGTDEAYFSHRPNDLLKVAIIEWCRETGRSEFILGGGYQPADGIFRYKLSFAPTGLREFHIGRRILNQAVYGGLVGSRREEDPERRPNPDYFPAYRA